MVGQNLTFVSNQQEFSGVVSRTEPLPGGDMKIVIEPERDGQKWSPLWVYTDDLLDDNFQIRFE